jgi:hypothetical protein
MPHLRSAPAQQPLKEIGLGSPWQMALLLHLAIISQIVCSFLQMALTINLLPMAVKLALSQVLIAYT